MEQQPLNLDQLPVEILASIFSNLDAAADLRCLCTVSQRFRHIAERQLYSQIKVTKLRQARRFALALRERPGRHALVRHASLFSTDRLDEDGGSRFRWTCLMLCPRLFACENLETLQLVSRIRDPKDASTAEEADQWHDVFYYRHDLCELFAKASFHVPPEHRCLTRLTTLQLYFENASAGADWTLGPLVHIFLHPTLREIALHKCEMLQQDCALLDALQSHRFSRSSPLETLRLSYCMPRADAVQKILSIPRALKVFNYLPPDPFDADSPYDKDWSLDLDVWTDIFMQQKHSLEDIRFSIWDFDGVRGRRGCLDLRNMQRLRLFAGDLFLNERVNVKVPVGTVVPPNLAPDFDQWTPWFSQPETAPYIIPSEVDVDRVNDMLDFDDMDFENDFGGEDEVDDDWL